MRQEIVGNSHLQQSAYDEGVWTWGAPTAERTRAVVQLQEESCTAWSPWDQSEQIPLGLMSASQFEVALSSVHIWVMFRA